MEYIKHRVSLEGHPWPGCRPEVIPGVHYSYGQTKQRGLDNVGQVNPKDCYLSRKELWPARRGYPGCKTLQMWMARDQPAASQMSEMDTPAGTCPRQGDASGGMNS